MTWKDPNKEPPPDCEPVLIYDKIVKACTVAYLIYDRKNKPVCWTIVDFDEYDQTISFNDISHWIELPEKPQVDQE